MLDPRQFPGGTVIVATGELSRFNDFTVSMQGLIAPPGSTGEWEHGSTVAANLNKAVRKSKGAWMWLMGDDHAFPSDTLLQLLDVLNTTGVDMVAPLVLKRKIPPETVAYRFNGVGGRLRLVRFDELPTDADMMKVDAVGGAGLLVKREVFDAMPDPWFELGKTKSDEAGEDIHFCLKARELGFSLYVDLLTHLAHMTVVQVRPHRHTDGTWQAKLHHGSGRSVLIDPKLLIEEG